MKARMDSPLRISKRSRITRSPFALQPLTKALNYGSALMAGNSLVAPSIRKRTQQPAPQEELAPSQRRRRLRADRFQGFVRLTEHTQYRR
jgi:hypothetical protein